MKNTGVPDPILTEVPCENYVRGGRSRDPRGPHRRPLCRVSRKGMIARPGGNARNGTSQT